MSKRKPADILIVDDNESDAMLMQEAVKNTVMANSIQIVYSAKDAIKYLNKNDNYEDAPRPDLILLDLKMPEMDGHDLLKIIKKDPRFMHIPVIMLTTSADQNDVEESYRLHANCYIVKPVNFAKFKSMVAVINEFWLGLARLPPKDM